jgi:hypothetical protein
MPTYRNKETGELKKFGRTRTYVDYDSSSGGIIKREFDLSTGDQINLNVWEYLGEDGDYSNITAKKAFNDGDGIR